MPVILALLFAGASVYLFFKANALANINLDFTAPDSPPDSSVDPSADTSIDPAPDMFKSFVLPPAAAPYQDAIAKSEAANGLPPGMLGALLYQESHYHEDIIAGRVKSKAGAIGIAQFMPATAHAYSIDPHNPQQSIDAAGKLLADLYRQTGDWSKALAAYNWGIGNVKNKGIDNAPVETRQYVSAIMSNSGLV